MEGLPRFVKVGDQIVGVLASLSVFIVILVMMGSKADPSRPWAESYASPAVYILAALEIMFTLAAGYGIFKSERWGFALAVGTALFTGAGLVAMQTLAVSRAATIDPIVNNFMMVKVLSSIIPVYSFIRLFGGGSQVEAYPASGASKFRIYDQATALLAIPYLIMAGMSTWKSQQALDARNGIQAFPLGLAALLVIDLTIRALAGWGVYHSKRWGFILAISAILLGGGGLRSLQEVASASTTDPMARLATFGDSYWISVFAAILATYSALRVFGGLGDRPE